MKKLNFILFLLISIQIFSQKNEPIDTEFFIPIEKTNLYARVVGNPDKPIIITLHGGPGAFNVDHEFFRNVFENRHNSYTFILYITIINKRTTDKHLLM